MFMGGVSNTSSRVLDLTYFSRSQRSMFEQNFEAGVFCYYLTCWNVLTSCEYVSGHLLHLHQISARLDFKYGSLVVILENRRAVSLVVIICFRSHFITTRGIDLKLSTCVPLGHGTYQAEI
jgi:hypothetical protein